MSILWPPQIWTVTLGGGAPAPVLQTGAQSGVVVVQGHIVREAELRCKVSFCAVGTCDSGSSK